ncbi:MAG: hypothetical protein H0W50_04115 [Parachlamydiaceae bacterium]|nr:hypothetical protein [Parachlamydiaceae bacterium]
MRILNVNTFFSKYILDPASRELTFTERMVATVASCFLLLFFGVPHIISYFWNSKKVSKIDLQKKINANFKSVHKVNDLFGQAVLKKRSPIKQPSASITSKKIQLVVQDFVGKFYSKPLPPKADVEVPFNGGMVKWSSLTIEQKLEVNNKFAHPHGKLSTGLYGKMVVDLKIFTKDGQATFIPNDPRKHHGSDHCVRAAIFAGVFGYLYKKYHPELDPTLQDIYLAQAAAAGHDSGRQTEGTDLWDDQSAENTVTILGEMGIKEEKIEECRDAIAHKDNKNLSTKSFIAKCVQNADCAEYPRIDLKKGSQDRRAFDDSAKYLDIYNEMKEIAKGDRNAVLKHGLTYGDFLKELEFVRTEMNALIFKTHKKKARLQFSKEDTNYYSQILGKINSVEFPLINHILVESQIKKDNSFKSEHERARETANDWIKLGQLEKISLEQIREVASKLNQKNQKDKEICGIIGSELLARLNSAASLLRENKDLEIQKLLKNPDENHNAEFAELICKHAADLLLNFKNTNEERRDYQLPIIAALAYKKAADIYLKLGEKERVQQVLGAAAADIILDSTTPFSEIIKQEKMIPSPVYFLMGSSSFSRRKLRLCNLNIDGEKWIEVSVELTSKARLDFTKYLNLLKENPQASVKTVDAKFLKKDFVKNQYDSKNSLKIGTDFKVTFNTDGIESESEVLVGNQQTYYNEYKHLRIRMKAGSDLNQLHKIFCSLGMPEALCESTDDDINQELLARVLTFRFPELVFEPVSQEKFKDSPDECYNKLSDEQKKIVDADIKNMVLKQVGPGNFEYVNPTLKIEAYNLGARALGSFIHAGMMKSTAQVVAKILKDSMLSSQERFSRGILGLGCAPVYNYKTGSANQVFTRIFTDNYFKDNTELSKFAITGPVLVLLDLQAFERLPYTYLEDRGGLRNPQFKQRFMWAEKQYPIFNYQGHTRMLDRKGFHEGITKLAKEKSFLNETMFENSISGSYIKKLVVWTEDDRLILMKELAREGIESVNGLPLEKAVVASQTLNSSLLVDF